MNQSPIRVLLIESNPQDAHQYLEALRLASSPGFLVTHVQRLDQALQHLDDMGFDLILVDLLLPDAQGFDALVKTRRVSSLVPIIVLVDETDESSGLRAVREGAQDFLVKGQFDERLLVRAMRCAVERKHAGQAWPASEARWRPLTEYGPEMYHTLLLTSPDAVITCDLEGDITFASPRAASLYGFGRADELLGRNWLELVDPADRERARTSLHTNLAGRARQEGTPRDADYAMLQKDGTRFIGKLDTALIRQTSGEPNAFLTITRDISKQREVEKGLKQKLRETLLLNRVIAATSSAHEPSAVLEIVCRELAHTLELPQAAFALLEADGTHLRVVAEYLEEGRPSALGALIPVADNRATQYVLEQLIPLAIANAQTDPRQAVIHDLEKERGTVSLLIVPVLSHGRVLGTLGLDSIEPREFSAEEIALAQSVAAAAGQAVERAKLTATLQQELAERKLAEQRLSRINQCFLSFGPDPLENIGHLTALCGELLGATCAVYNHLAGDTLVSWAQWNTPANYDPVGKPEGQVCYDPRQRPGLIQSADDQVLCVSNLPETAYAQTDPNAVPKGLRTWGRSVKSRDSYVGSLCALFREDFVPSTEQVQILEFAASAIGVEEKRKAAEEDLLQRTEQMEALRQVGLELAAQLELDTLLTSLVSRAVDLTGSTSGSLYLHHPDENLLELTVTVGRDPGLVGTKRRRGKGLAGKVWQAGKPLIVGRPVGADPRACPPPCLAATEQPGNPGDASLPSSAMLGVPVRWGAEAEEFLGVLEVSMDAQVQGRCGFSQGDSDLLILLATEAAIALQNARLFEAERKQRELAEVLRDAAQAMGASLDLDEILRRMLEQLKRVVVYDTASVLILQDGDIPALTVGVGYTEEQIVSREANNLLRNSPILRQLDRDRRPIASADVRQVDGWIWVPGAEHVRSWMGIPLMAHDRMIGVLMIDHSQPGFYGESELQTAEVLGRHAAQAIENAQLFQAERKARRQTETLQAATRALGTTLDLQEVLELILRELRHVVPYDSSSVQQIQGNESVIISGHGFPKRGDLLGIRFDLLSEDSPNGIVARTRAPLVLSDAPATYSQFHRAPHDQACIRSWLGVPLLFGDHLIGMITLDKREPGFYTSEHAHLALAFAAQAAIAIQNARLFADLQQSHEALAAERALLAERVAERTAELSAANAELSRASRLKDEFLAAMSHELRTPLSAILGLTEALQEQVYGRLNQKQLASLQRIEESGRHLLALINDILDVSKIEAGKLELEISAVPVKRICQACLHLASQDAQKKGIEITFHLDETVEFLRADERRLKQILVNLLSNAIKFTPAGNRIGLEVVGDVEQQAVHFTVWDPGIGISQEDMRKLFQPFMQLDSSLSRQYKGTGLGLSLVRRLTEMHGGGISLESTVGQGSRFTVSLPWAEAATVAGTDAGAAVRATPTESREPTVQSSPAHTRLDGATILIVEHNEITIDTLSNFLSAQGCQVLVARNAVEAMQQATQTCLNLVLVDIELSGSGALHIVHRLSSGEGYGLRAVPVIAITALALPGDGERYLAAGASEVLRLPVALHHLVDTIVAHAK